MFTNTNIHDELGDDFTGATTMSNAEVKLALNAACRDLGSHSFISFTS